MYRVLGSLLFSSIGWYYSSKDGAFVYCLLALSVVVVIGTNGMAGVSGRRAREENDY